MKSMKRLLTTLFAVLALPTLVFSAQDPVSVSKIDFRKLSAQDIPSSSGQWTRIVVELLGNENPDKKAFNKDWIRDVEVTLTLVYFDQKAKKSERMKPENMIVLKNKARLFALKVNAKTPVVFYIPSEAYNVYRLSKEPFAYSIELSANGAAVALPRENLKTLLSASIVKAGDPKKVYDSYQKLVQSASAANENVLMTLPQTPYNVQKFEYDNAKGIPTYLQTK